MPLDLLSYRLCTQDLHAQALCAQDRDLIRRDPALPGLEILLEPAALLTELERVGLRGLEDARISYVRYKPRTSTLVAYEVRQEGETVHLYAKAHRADADDKLSKAEMKMQGRGAMLPRHIAVYLFPHDRRLELDKLTDDQKRAALFEKTPRLQGLDLALLRYKPERRFVGTLSEDGTPRAVLKHYTPQGFERAVRGAAAFHSVQGADDLELAPLLRRSHRRRVLVFGWCAGVSLEGTLRRPVPPLEEVGRTGAALRTLHAQGGEGLEGPSRRQEAAQLLAIAADLAFLLPALQKRVNAVAQKLIERLEAAEPRHTPLHGDFSADQVLAGDAITILDFDNARLGDPAADLGTFAAQLEWDALTGTFPRTTSRRC